MTRRPATASGLAGLPIHCTAAALAGAARHEDTLSPAATPSSAMAPSFRASPVRTV